MPNTQSPIETYRELRDRWSFDPLAAQITSAIIAAAMVLPLLGIVIYGFSAGWDVLGGAALAVILVLGIVYYLILWGLMKRRNGGTGSAAGR